METPTQLPEAVKKKRRRRANRGAFGQELGAGEWPLDPPFTIKRQRSKQFFNLGRLSQGEYRSLREEYKLSRDETFPWHEYLAESFGVGTYSVEWWKDGDAKTEKKMRRSRFDIATATVEAVQRQVRDNPSVDGEDGEDLNDDDIERIAARVAKDPAAVAALKKALGLENPPPPVPVKSGLASVLETLNNPAIQPFVPTLMKLIIPAPAPTAQTSPWAEVGRTYEAIGYSPERVMAELAENIRAAQAQQGAPGTAQAPE